MLGKAVRSLIKILSPLLLLILGFFFSKNALRGSYFEESLIGYRWAFRSIWQRNIPRLAAPLPFPATFSCQVSNGYNIEFHPDDLNNFQTGGTYYQNFGAKIRIGRGTYIAPNVGINTANHDPSNLDGHMPAEEVVIGNSCWIGMNAIIIPGVHLGSGTIVRAGSVVTRSFIEGGCIIAGNSARIIRNLSSSSDGDAG